VNEEAMVHWGNVAPKISKICFSPFIIMKTPKWKKLALQSASTRHMKYGIWVGQAQKIISFYLNSFHLCKEMHLYDERGEERYIWKDVIRQQDKKFIFKNIFYKCDGVFKQHGIWSSGQLVQTYAIAIKLRVI